MKKKNVVVNNYQGQKNYKDTNVSSWAVSLL